MNLKVVLYLKKILRKVNTLNVVLLAAGSSLALFSYTTFFEPYKIDLKSPKSNSVFSSQKLSFSEKQPVLELADFNVIPEKNLFRPDRKPHVPSPPPPPPPPPPSPPPPPPIPKQKVPDPQLTVNGVLITDGGFKRTILSGYYYKLKEGGNAVRNMRGSRARLNMTQVKIQNKSFKEGAELGDYKIQSIKERRITLVRPSDGNILKLELSFKGYKQIINKAVARRNPFAARTNANARGKRIPPSPGAATPLAGNRNVRRVQNRIDNRSTPFNRSSNKSVFGGGRRQQEVPAVFAGGRVYYPENGSPPPPPPSQNISGATTNGSQHISGR